MTKAQYDNEELRKRIEKVGHFERGIGEALTFKATGNSELASGVGGFESGTMKALNMRNEINSMTNTPK